jgi:hypothetical protein
MKTTIISSNSTLVYKLFLPFFVSAVLIALCLAAWTDEQGGVFTSLVPTPIGNIIFSLLTLGWLWLAWNKLWTLRRVEIDDTNIYVSDYWNTTKYALSDIEAVKQRKTLWLPMATIILKGKGRFGRDIRFIKGRDAHAALAGF